MDMEHMKMRWRVEADYCGYRIELEENGMTYVVCHVYREIPGDPTGKRTANAICDEHNAALERAGK